MRRVNVQTVAGFLVLFALTTCGCSGDKTDKTKTDKARRHSPEEPRALNGRSEKTTEKTSDVVITNVDPSKDRADSREAKVEDAHIGGVTSGSGKKGPKSGILTSGSFDD